MATMLTVTYGSSDIFNRAKKLSGVYSDVAERTQSIGGRVAQMPESQHNNIANASAFLRKKREQYAQNAEKFSAFGQRVSSFMNEARDTDQRVRDHISSAYKTFRRQTGIGKSKLVYGIGKLWDGLLEGGKFLLAVAVDAISTLISPLKLLWNAIKDWYNTWPDWLKYVIKTASSILLLVVAVAALVAAIPTGGLTLGPLILALLGTVSAGVSVFTASVSVAKNLSSLLCYFGGKQMEARRISEMSGLEFFGVVGESYGMDAKAFQAFYLTVELVGAICGVASFSLKTLDKITTSKMKLSIPKLKKFIQEEFFMNAFRGHAKKADYTKWQKTILTLFKRSGADASANLNNINKMASFIPRSSYKIDAFITFQKIFRSIKDARETKDIGSVLENIPIVEKYWNLNRKAWKLGVELGSE